MKDNSLKPVSAIKSRVWDFIRHDGHDSGAVLIEFALVSILLIPIMGGIFEGSRYWLQFRRIDSTVKGVATIIAAGECFNSDSRALVQNALPNLLTPVKVSSVNIGAKAYRMSFYGGRQGRWPLWVAAGNRSKVSKLVDQAFTSGDFGSKKLRYEDEDLIVVAASSQYKPLFKGILPSLTIERSVIMTPLVARRLRKESGSGRCHTR